MKKQTGFTLPELLISLLLGLIVIGGAITIYISTIRGSADTIRSARLNHDLDSALSLMVNDIRRAGYWGGAVAGSNSQNNPFMSMSAPLTNIRIHNQDINRIGNCVLYTYDVNGNATVDAGEFFGFRLNNAAIEMFLSNTITTTDVATCTSNTGWQALTISDTSGERINITRLAISFDPIPPNLPASSRCRNVFVDFNVTPPENSLCEYIVNPGAYLSSDDRVIETRQVNIVIEGEVGIDAAVTKTVSDSVKVRNDRIFTYDP